MAARRIRKLSEIGLDEPIAEQPGDAPQDVVFINNYLNREFTLPNQAKFKFQTSRQVFTDSAQIEHLRKLIAESVNARIFEETPEVLPPAANLDDEPPASSPIVPDPVDPDPAPLTAATE